MVLTISSLSLNKFRGDFLIKCVDWKDGIFSWFFDKYSCRNIPGPTGVFKKHPMNSGDHIHKALERATDTKVLYMLSLYGPGHPNSTIWKLNGLNRPFKTES